jgi:hypothetical protein
LQTSSILFSNSSTGDVSTKPRELASAFEFTSWAALSAAVRLMALIAILFVAMLSSPSSSTPTSAKHVDPSKAATFSAVSPARGAARAPVVGAATPLAAAGGVNAPLAPEPKAGNAEAPAAEGGGCGGGGGGPAAPPPRGAAPGALGGAKVAAANVGGGDGGGGGGPAALQVATVATVRRYGAPERRERHAEASGSPLRLFHLLPKKQQLDEGAQARKAAVLAAGAVGVGGTTAPACGAPTACGEALRTGAAAAARVAALAAGGAAAATPLPMCAATVALPTGALGGTSTTPPPCPLLRAALLGAPPSTGAATAAPLRATGGGGAAAKQRVALLAAPSSVADGGGAARADGAPRSVGAATMDSLGAATCAPAPLPTRAPAATPQLPAAVRLCGHLLQRAPTLQVCQAPAAPALQRALLHRAASPLLLLKDHAAPLGQPLLLGGAPPLVQTLRLGRGFAHTVALGENGAGFLQEGVRGVGAKLLAARVLQFADAVFASPGGPFGAVAVQPRLRGRATPPPWALEQRVPALSRSAPPPLPLMDRSAAPLGQALLRGGAAHAPRAVVEHAPVALRRPRPRSAAAAPPAGRHDGRPPGALRCAAARRRRRGACAAGRSRSGTGLPRAGRVGYPSRRAGQPATGCLPAAHARGRARRGSAATGARGQPRGPPRVARFRELG